MRGRRSARAASGTARRDVEKVLLCRVFCARMRERSGAQGWVAERLNAAVLKTAEG